MVGFVQETLGIITQFIFIDPIEFIVLVKNIVLNSFGGDQNIAIDVVGHLCQTSLRLHYIYERKKILIVFVVYN